MSIQDKICGCGCGRDGWMMMVVTVLLVRVHLIMQYYIMPQAFVISCKFYKLMDGWMMVVVTVLLVRFN